MQLGDLKIQQQEMGLVNQSAEWLDFYASGTMGLGYPEIASIHPIDYNTTSALGYLWDRLLYPTLLTRMAQAGVEP